MIYIRNNNSVTYSGQKPNYIGDFLGKEHSLNNCKLLDYDPYYSYSSILSKMFKELYSDKLIDLIPDQPYILKRLSKKKSKV